MPFLNDLVTELQQVLSDEFNFILKTKHLNTFFHIDLLQ